MLGYWARRLADGGLVAALTATSPPRLGHPGGGRSWPGRTRSIGIPSSDGRPLVTDVSIGRVTYGDVIAGAASENELAAASMHTRPSRWRSAVTRVAAQVIDRQRRRDRDRRHAGAIRAERVRAAARAQPAAVREAARVSVAVARGKCVDGIEANREVCERYAELMLSVATALNPYIGYDAASEIVKGGRLVGPSAPRGRARAGRLRGRGRQGARLPRHSEAARPLTASLLTTILIFALLSSLVVVPGSRRS